MESLTLYAQSRRSQIRRIQWGTLLLVALSMGAGLSGEALGWLSAIFFLLLGGAALFSRRGGEGVLRLTLEGFAVERDSRVQCWR